MASAQPVTRPICLVVEDDPLLRLQAIDVAESAGFDVIDVGNADEAIAILLDRLDIRIVFTDIDMPGSMDGLKLAATVRDRWPPIEIIIVSGMVRLSNEQLPTRGVFFAKPYDPSQVIDAMKRFLPAS